MICRYPKPAPLARLGARHAVVEASAGTGKTFILEHLVVDLLLTRDATLDQILVVTFTEKATAELIQRVRAKLQELRDLSPDDTLARAAEALPESACWTLDDRARRKLGRALLEFDRASISTIHGFCQRLLVEHAFAGQRLFDEQAVDEKEAFHGAFAETLRRELASDAGITPYLAAWAGLGKPLGRLEQIVARAERALACLYPSRPGALRPPPLNEAQVTSAAAAFASTLPDAEALKALLLRAKVPSATARAVPRWTSDLGALARQWSAPADVPKLLTAVALFDARRSGGGALAYIEESLAKGAADPEVARLARCFAAFVDAAGSLAGALVNRVLPRVARRLEQSKREAGLFDFQDMLTLVARSLEGEGPRQQALLAALRGRYRFALVDECQDTDEVQWSIFRRLFFDSPDGHVLTLIGDPKQAIYGFRGADVHTYLRARAEIEGAGGEVVHLTANFRSTEPLIQAYNAILDQQAPFFRAGGGIRYDHPVTCGRPALALTDGAGKALPALVVLDVETTQKTVLTWQVKRVLQAQLVAQVRVLLDAAGRPHFGAPGQARPLRAADIFVLTRTIRESREVGAALGAAGLPFAYFKQEKLYDTTEASEVLDLLRAIADPEDRTARSRAFITPFFGLALPDLAACDDLGRADGLMRLLYRWRALADKGDFEGLFASIVDDSGIICRELFLRDSERSLTNYLHLLEVLQEEAARSRATIRELAQTMGAYVHGTRRPPGKDRDIQRLESDADAVQIMTIHHAKGLEAAVVFVYGGFWPFRGNDVRVLHDEEGRRVVRVGRQPVAEEARFEQEDDDEERRVLYVALTRAKARLYLPRLPPAFNLRGCYRAVNERLAALLGGFSPDETRALFHRVPIPCPGDAPPVAAPPPPAALEAWRPPPALLAPDPPDDEARALAGERAGFLMTSYSAVKRLHGGFVPAAEAAEDPAANEPGGADEPTALPPTDLPRGRLSGIFLHEVIEHLPLETLAPPPPLDAWRRRPDIAALLERLRRRHDRHPAHLAHAAALVHTALTAPVRAGEALIPCLATVEHPTREMEFLYPIPERAHPLLGAGGDAGGAATDDPRAPFRIERGLVKGYIDFVFQHEGRVYVCDWKGDWLPAWDEPRVAAHCDRNYALQVHLYTLAALRLLGVAGAADYDRRFGGVLYCFLRGMRADDARAGVFYRRPTWDDVLSWQQEMLGQAFWGLS